MAAAYGFRDFARAVRRKMLLEIAGLAPPRPLFQLAAAGRRIPCDIGERQLIEWLENFDE